MLVWGVFRANSRRELLRLYNSRRDADLATAKYSCARPCWVEQVEVEGDDPQATRIAELEAQLDRRCTKCHIREDCRSWRVMGLAVEAVTCADYLEASCSKQP